MHTGSRGGYGTAGGRDADPARRGRGALTLEEAPFKLPRLLLDLESLLGAQARGKGLELIVRQNTYKA